MSRNNDALRSQRFDSIVEENRDRLGRIARVYGGSEAEDLLQEIMMQIWRSLPSFDQKSTTGTWCYRIALNTAITWKRSKTCAKRRPPENRVTPDSLESRTSSSNEGKLLEPLLDYYTEMRSVVEGGDDFTLHPPPTFLQPRPRAPMSRRQRSIWILLTIVFAALAAGAGIVTKQYFDQRAGIFVASTAPVIAFLVIYISGIWRRDSV